MSTEHSLSSANPSEAIAYLREVHRGTVRAERVEVLVREIEALRDVLVFADGGWVHQTGQALADIYQPEAEAQAVLARAGCWPRGSHAAGLADALAIIDRFGDG